MVWRCPVAPRAQGSGQIQSVDHDQAQAAEQGHRRQDQRVSMRGSTTNDQVRNREQA
jgi:hypothetical protein